MNNWKRKLTSRKLWLSIAGFASMLLVYFGASETEGAKVAALIMAGASVIGYVIGEGLADGSPYFIEDEQAEESENEPADTDPAEGE